MVFSFLVTSFRLFRSHPWNIPHVHLYLSHLHGSIQALADMDKDARVRTSYILSSVFQPTHQRFLCIVTSLSTSLSLNPSVPIHNHLWYRKCLSMKKRELTHKDEKCLSESYLNSTSKSTSHEIKDLTQHSDVWGKSTFNEETRSVSIFTTVVKLTKVWQV